MKMRRVCFEAHLKAKYGAHINSDSNYSANLEHDFKMRTTLKPLFTDHIVTINRVLQTSD